MTESQNNKLALFMGVLFLLLGLGGVVGSWGAYFTDTNIAKHGAQADARLLSKIFMGTADGTSEYIFEYSFETPDQQVINASRAVSKERWEALQEGASFEVRYSDTHPKRNFPAGEGVTSVRVTVFVSLIAAMFAAFGGALLWGLAHRNATAE